MHIHLFIHFLIPCASIHPHTYTHPPTHLPVHPAILPIYPPFHPSSYPTHPFHVSIHPTHPFNSFIHPFFLPSITIVPSHNLIHWATSGFTKSTSSNSVNCSYSKYLKQKRLYVETWDDGGIQSKLIWIEHFILWKNLTSLTQTWTQ